LAKARARTTELQQQVERTGASTKLLHDGGSIRFCAGGEMRSLRCNTGLKRSAGRQT
jgi:hypothetical protein